MRNGAGSGMLIAMRWFVFLAALSFAPFAAAQNYEAAPIVSA
mgnify:CR=1 FL=1